MTEFTINDFLGGKVQLKQPKAGYRATSDAVLVAAAVCAKPGQTVLDVGCGGGVVGLCVAARVPHLMVTGVELQPELATLAAENAALNRCEMTIVPGDVGRGIKALHGVQFHHVVTNPPFYTETPKRKEEQVETAYKQVLPIADWLKFCLKHVRAKGTLTIIHRTEAVPEIMAYLNGRLGGLTLIPVYPKPGGTPKRVIIRGEMGSKKPFALHPGIVLHNPDNSRTLLAEEIMRNGASLE